MDACVGSHWTDGSVRHAFIPPAAGYTEHYCLALDKSNSYYMKN